MRNLKVLRHLKVRIRLHDLLFFFLLVFSFYFTRNMLCRLMMAAFFGYTLVRHIATNRKTHFSFYYIGFLVFILYGAGNILFNNVINAQVARTMVVSLLLNLMMIYSIVQYIYMRNDIAKVLRITELGIFTTAFAVILFSLGSLTEDRLGRATEMNANMLAILSVYGFVLCLYLRKIGKFTTWSLWFRLGFYVLTILLTGSRKGLIMIFISSMVISFIYGKRKLVRNILIGIVAMVVAYVAVMNVGFLYNAVGVRIENLLLYLGKGTIAESSLFSRVQLLEIAEYYIAKKPWTGYGYDCFKTVSGMAAGGKVSGDGFGYYSHNNYTELLFGGGIIGLVLYYIPVVYLLKKLFTKLKVEPSIMYLLAIYISKLAVEYAYVSYYERVDAYIVAIILGCTLIARKNVIDISDVTKRARKGYYGIHS